MDFLSYLETIFGWIYFVAWSVTFYPQVFIIIKHRNCYGFSPDYMIFNDVGFISYSIFTAVSFWNASARLSYQEHTGVSPQVEFNDIVFALHGAIMCMILTLQLLYYPPRTYPHRLNVIVCATVQVIVILGLFYSISSPNSNWFLYLRFTGLVKVGASLVKHIPQALLNVERQSTVGYSFVMVCIDTVGSLFSLAQQCIRCLRLGSWAPFTANMAKTVLAIESMLFDFFFMTQHLVWYRDRRGYEVLQSGDKPPKSSA